MSRIALHLRPLTPADADVLAAWGADAAFCAAAEWTAGRSPAQYRERWLAMIAAGADDLIRLGVATAADDLVGYVDLHGHDPHERELGYLIGGRARWGHGLGSQAAALMLAHGFQTLGLQTITAEAWDTNIASIRILQRLGMRETGRGDTGRYAGITTFYRQFAITVDAWRTRHLQAVQSREMGRTTTT